MFFLAPNKIDTLYDHTTNSTYGVLLYCIGFSVIYIRTTCMYDMYVCTGMIKLKMVYYYYTNT